MSTNINTKNPSVVLNPEDLPQQRLTVVRNLTDFPEDWKYFVHGWPEGVKEDLTTYDTLCSLEWAWSPMHNRLQLYAFQKSLCGKYGLLTIGQFNDESLFQQYDEDGEPLDDDIDPWTLQEAGHCIYQPRLSLKENAVLCVIEDLRFEKGECDLDPFHWVQSEDLLDCADLAAIARVVWGEEEGEDDEY